MHSYLVGGAVRDKLLGLPIKDKDYVVIGATPEYMLQQGYTQVGHDFPVFLHPVTHCEYALARTERKSGSGYTGFICSFGPEVTLEEDLKRRDLTVNAIAEDEETGRIIDPYGGVQDLQNRVLRHISPAFSEDPLRVLRVARFAAKLHNLGFVIAPETMQLMHDMAHSGELKALTPERVWMEIEKAMATPRPDVFIGILHECGALGEVLPEAEALSGVPGPAKWHPEIDTLVHTMLTMKAVAAMTDDPKVRFAMLCHDIGKALTPKDNWPHHYHHNELGLIPLKQLSSRLHLPNDYTDFAYIVVLYHDQFHHLGRNGAEGIVRLFENLDGYRRPDRVVPWLMCCKADFLGRKGFEDLPFPRFDVACQLFELTRKVTAAPFVKQGLKGKDIGLAMHNKRVELVAEAIAKMPADALQDKEPPRPVIV